MPTSVRAPSENQRAHARAHVEIDVTLVSDSQLYTGLSENLSEAGVFVATHAVRKIGETIELTLTLSDSKPIRTVGEVRWIREASDRLDTPPGIAFRFVALTEEDAETIRGFLKKRDPLFFEE